MLHLQSYPEILHIESENIIKNNRNNRVDSYFRCKWKCHTDGNIFIEKIISKNLHKKFLKFKYM